jgi:N-acyl-D-amino-acid deacylase
MNNEFLFRKATLYDGTGAPSYISDLYVKDGFIQEIASSISDKNCSTIDCEGLALMPGIIDGHTHFDAQITWDPYLHPTPSMGVTSVVIGNCGFTIAPCRPSDRDLTLRNLTQVEGMSIDVLREGVNWNFESFSEFFDAIKKRGIAVNVAGFVGHSSVRTFVMGADATERAATDEEISQMQELVRNAMHHGAIGFSSSTSPAHNGDMGKPMPSRLAEEKEITALVQAMAESGRGVFMLTKGNTTSIDYLEGLVKESKRPVFVAAILHNSTNPGVAISDLEKIRQANARGQKMLGQVSCCSLSMDFTMESPYPLEGLTSWKPALGKKGEELKKYLADASFRQSIKEELSVKTTVRLFNGEWAKLSIVEAALDSNRALEHRTIADIALERQQDPLDVFFDIAIEENLKTFFVAVLLNSDTDAVGELLNHPYSLVSLSDSGAHLTFFNDAGFGLHLMGYWSRELGKMTLEQAVYQLTGFQADAFGFKDRGRLQVGMAADLLLFDPQIVGRGQKRKVFDLPGNRARLHTDPLGVKGVWVNGVEVVGESGLADLTVMPGKLVQEFAV